jgi:hypothetical protein
MRRRKARIDSASEAVQCRRRRARLCRRPACRSKSAIFHFLPAALRNLPSEWTAHQLELAAMLARTMADLNREQQALRAEGSVVHTEKGTPVVNPRKAVVQMHASSILSFRRSLSLHARARGARRRQLRQTILLMMVCWPGRTHGDWLRPGAVARFGDSRTIFLDA